MTRNIYVIPRVHRGSHDGGIVKGAGPSPFSGSERPKPGPMLAGGVADTAGARPFER